MLDYNLREDEVVLYKGFVTLAENDEIKQLLLTNINLAFISKYKKLNADTEVFIDTYPVKEIKVYQEEPQIKVHGTNVEIYFLHGEKEFNFSSKADLHKFMHEIKDLLSGKTKAEIKAEKKERTQEIVNTSVKVAGAVSSFLPTNFIPNSLSGIAKVFKKKKK